MVDGGRATEGGADVNTECRSSDENALMAAVRENPQEETPRLVLADWWDENDRPDVAAMWRGIRELGGVVNPNRPRTRPRVDTLTGRERKRMPAWVKKWIRIGLSTQPADRPLFEAAVTQCYIASGLNPPRVVWCKNPLVTVLAGSMYLLRKNSAVHDAVRGAVDDAVRGAVDDAVRGAVDDAVDGAVHDAVDGAVHDAVRGAVDGAVRGAVDDAVHDLYWRYLGGQFWVGWWWGSAAITFYLDVLRLRIPAPLELAARAYAATCCSACWWYPTTDTVFVSERPHTLKVRPGQKPIVKWDGFEVGT